MRRRLYLMVFMGVLMTAKEVVQLYCAKYKNIYCDMDVVYSVYGVLIGSWHNIDPMLNYRADDYVHSYYMDLFDYDYGGYIYGGVIGDPWAYFHPYRSEVLDAR